MTNNNNKDTIKFFRNWSNKNKRFYISGKGFNPETKQNDNTQVTQKNTQIDHGTLFPLYCVIFVYFFQFILVYRANSVYIID